MHLQKVCILFALLILLVLLLVSRSEGFEQKVTLSTTSDSISALANTETQKSTGPIGNSSSLLKVSPGLPPLSPMPIGISPALKAIPQGIPKVNLQASQGPTGFSQAPVSSNPTGGSSITSAQGFVAYDLSRQEQREREEREKEIEEKKKEWYPDGMY
jgi:hypothetical protein